MLSFLKMCAENRQMGAGKKKKDDPWIHRYCYEFFMFYNQIFLV